MSEAGEHGDAVDNAVANLQASNRNGSTNLPVDKRGAPLIAQPIALANGLTVSAGDVSAMMGDFYGAYTKGADGKEHFDPLASWEELNHADPIEMKMLLDRIAWERTQVNLAKDGVRPFHSASNGDYEEITHGREMRTDRNGTTTGYSFLDLAQKNTSHFNAKQESDRGVPLTDNNMGAYTAFHMMALQSAQYAATLPPGSEERMQVENRMRGFEASAGHFLTDRFAGGHQFDKQALMDRNGNGVAANGVARVVHNEANTHGVDVANKQGDQWHAFGDSHWADAGNERNRGQTSAAILGSYGDIHDVLSGDKTVHSFYKDPANAVRGRVPEFDDSLNEKTLATGQDRSPARRTVDALVGLAGEADRRLLDGIGDRLISKGLDWARKTFIGDDDDGRPKHESDYKEFETTFDAHTFAPMTIEGSPTPPARKAGPKAHLAAHPHYAEGPVQSIDMPDDDLGIQVLDMPPDDLGISAIDMPAEHIDVVHMQPEDMGGPGPTRERERRMALPR